MVKEKLYNIPCISKEDASKKGYVVDALASNVTFNEVANLDLHYQPIVSRRGEEADDDGYHVEADGFGGSDAGAIYGVNHNRPAALACMQKLGLVERDTPTDELQYIFDNGHVMEIPLIALYERQSGNECWRDRSQYQHPFYPWMKADMDGFCRLPNGEIAIVECKTHSTMKQVASKWHSGVYGVDGTLGRPEYLIQAAHDMAVCNLNTTIFIAGSSNNPNDVTIVTVKRDLELERDLINVEGKVWTDMLNFKLPQSDSFNDAAYDAFVKGFRRVELEDDQPPVEIDATHLDIINKIDELNVISKNLDEQKKANDAKINALKVQLIQEIGGVERAICGDKKITYTTSTRTSVDSKKLQLNFPEVYEQVKKTTESKPTLKIK